MITFALILQRALALLRGLPWPVYAVAFIACLLAWHLHGDKAARAAARLDGRNEALAEAARMDSAADAAATVARANVDTARRTTDSARVRVRVRAEAIDSTAQRAVVLVQQLPPSINTLPAVIALKEAVFTLATEATGLRAALRADSLALADERTKVTAAFALDSAAIVSARLVAVARSDTIRVLERRPTRTKAVLYTIGGAIVAALTTYGVTR